MDNKKSKIEVKEDLGIISEDMQLPFPLYEYKNRLNKVRKEMEMRGIDLLYLTMPESLFYISGLNFVWYKTNSSPQWNDSKMTGIAVHVDYDDFILFEIPDEEGTIYGSTCATDIRIKDDTPGAPSMFGKEYEAPKGGQSMMDLIIKDLKEEGWLNCRAALEMGSPRPNRKVSEMFQAKLEREGCTVVDGTDILLKLRGKKSPLELNYIEKASELADIGHRAILNGMREGMTELELVAEYTSAMWRAGGESMAIVDMCRFGKGKLWWVHSPASRKRLMIGDPVLVDLCGVYNRYHSDQVRVYSFGEPDPETAATYAKATKIMYKVKEILRPNLLINDFYAQLVDFFKEEGMWGEQYWLGGYEMGISFPPDWCGNFVYDPYIDARDARFEPGMVVNFETGFGIVDTLMFTETEAKILGTTPWELQIVEP